ncbi:MAG: hypothetical protein EXR74_04345 [Bdellovibrionales bacterium]|nr:hypothetical protein [Bdellovibrionales bacterium]
MAKFFSLLFLATITLSAEEVDPQRYNINQLELMAKNHRWSEVILYVKDIPKSEQNLQWKNLVERASFGYVLGLKSQGFSDARQIMEDLIQEFPFLRSYSKFEKLKDEIYLTGYEKCFSKASDIPQCTQTALVFMNDKIVSPDLRQKLAFLINSKSEKSLEKLCAILDSFKEKNGFFIKSCLDKGAIEKTTPAQ